MDSGNSGSLHSSSGGDEEYDSRAADSVSVFNPPPFFDPISNYLQLHQNPNSSFLNPTMAWPRTSTTTLRSDPNPITYDNTINPMLPSSPPPFMPSFQQPAAGNLAPPPAQSHQNHNQAAARNPKKRSRASRRAPTTVLTTDTTNFRAMVQEFTGIPAPPFSNIPSFPRSRLDLFGTRTNTTLETPPPYLRRPFAQKVQPPLPFFSSSSSSSSLLRSTAVDAIVAASSSPSNNNIVTSASSTTSAASSSTPAAINYQQLPITQSSNLFNISNPLLSSFLQSNPKFPFSNSPLMGAKPSFGIPSNDHLNEDFGLAQGNHVSATLSSLPNLIPSDQIALRNDNHSDNTDHSNNAVIWSNNPASPDGDKDEQINLNGSYNFTRINTMNSKMNFSASPASNFGGGKGPENVAAAARGEGMVESWICSSE